MRIRCLVAGCATLLLSGCALPILMAGPAIGAGGTVYAQKSAQKYGQRVGDQAAAMPAATARAIGGRVNPNDIQVLDAKYGKHSSSWIADTPAGRYACTMIGDGVDDQPAHCSKR